MIYYALLRKQAYQEQPRDLAQRRCSNQPSYRWVLPPDRGKTTVVRLRKDKEGACVYSKGNSAKSANAVAVCSNLSTMLSAVAETASLSKDCF